MMLPVISQSDPELDPGGVGGRVKDGDPCPVIIMSPGDRSDGDLVEVVLEFRRAASVMFLEIEGDIIIPFPIVGCLLQLNPTIRSDEEIKEQRNKTKFKYLSNCFHGSGDRIDLCQIKC